jgi:hypothetical protein
MSYSTNELITNRLNIAAGSACQASVGASAATMSAIISGLFAQQTDLAAFAKKLPERRPEECFTKRMR